eukprot:scaffold2921_cov61-Phaeocystis_antarctica.AAC.5
MHSVQSPRGAVPTIAPPRCRRSPRARRCPDGLQSSVWQARVSVTCPGDVGSRTSRSQPQFVERAERQCRMDAD